MDMYIYMYMHGFPHAPSHTLTCAHDLLQLRCLSVGCNDFPVDAHHQYLKTHETVQKWLKINLEVLFHTHTHTKIAYKLNFLPHIRTFCTKSYCI